jgi:DNA-binding IclR family transcriptional regulator
MVHLSSSSDFPPCSFRSGGRREIRLEFRSDMPRKPVYSVPALERGLDVLEILAGERQPLTLTQLAQRTEHSANSLFRITDCLVKRGFVKRDAYSGAFRLSLRVFELAHTHSPVEELLRSATTPMEELSAKLEESCHLSILDDGDLVIVAQSLANTPVRLSIEVGSRFPAEQTASGRLLLAFKSNAERQQWQRHKSKTQVPSGADLDQIRKTGYCTAYEETVRGVVDVAMPVGNSSIGVVGALTISALSPRNPTAFIERALPLLRLAAEAITRGSGLTGGVS